MSRGKHQFKVLPFGLSTVPLEFTAVPKGVKLMALQKGIRIHQYPDDWLVWARSHQTCQIIITGPQVSLQLCGLPVRPERGLGQTHPALVADTDNQNQRIINRTDLSSPAVHVPYRAFDSNRKTGSPRPTPYEVHTMAPRTKLQGSRITGKGDTSSQVTPPTI